MTKKRPFLYVILKFANKSLYLVLRWNIIIDNLILSGSLLLSY